MTADRLTSTPDPMKGRSISTPSVGVFWGLREAGAWGIVHASVPLAEAELYGDALTFAPGHAEVWAAWQALGPAVLRRRGLPAAILAHEYDHVPRGRVVFHRTGALFTLYADRRLQQPAPIARVVILFGLVGCLHVVRSDPHYRS